MASVALRKRGTESSLESFVAVDGMRVLLMWLNISEDDNNLPMLKEIVQLCSVIPYNVRTFEAIKATGIPKTIKKLSKSKHAGISEAATNCMHKWGAGNKAIKLAEGLEAQSAQQQHASLTPDAEAAYQETVKFISDRRNEYVSQRLFYCTYSSDRCWSF